VASAARQKKAKIAEEAEVKKSLPDHDEEMTFDDDEDEPLSSGAGDDEDCEDDEFEKHFGDEDNE
jgi:hypothetical protein